MESNIPTEYPSKPWQPLFDYLSGLCEIPPTLSEMDDLVNVVEKMIGHKALRAKVERYEKALKNIEVLGDGATIMHLRTCKKVATEALAGDGEKESAIAKICHALAEEVAKDADTAEAYLRKEGIDVEKVKEDAKFVEWMAELAALLHGAAQGQPIKINQEEARKWYDDGCTPYQCFRETWNME